MVVYFTGTGNSASIAKDLAKELREECLNINDAIKRQEEIKDQSIGIVYPAYFVDMPIPVKNFINSFLFQKEQYIYVVVTCASHQGNAGIMAGKILKKRGYKLSYKSVFKMPQNMGILLGGGKPSTDGLLERQETYIKKLAEDIKNRKENVKSLRTSVMYSMGNKVTYNKVTMKILKKEVDHDICVGCGVCQRICPVGNIKVIDGKSHMGPNCIECLACIHWCPNGSITAMKKHVDGRQYHHPKIILDDMFRRKYEENNTESKTENK